MQFVLEGCAKALTNGCLLVVRAILYLASGRGLFLEVRLETHLPRLYSPNGTQVAFSDNACAGRRRLRLPCRRAPGATSSALAALRIPAARTAFAWTLSTPTRGQGRIICHASNTHSASVGTMNKSSS